jgi:hypothetical protein
MPAWIVILARRVTCGSRIAALASSYPSHRVSKRPSAVDRRLRVFSAGRQPGSPSPAAVALSEILISPSSRSNQCSCPLGTNSTSPAVHSMAVSLQRSTP